MTKYNLHSEYWFGSYKREYTSMSIVFISLHCLTNLPLNIQGKQRFRREKNLLYTSFCSFSKLLCHQRYINNVIYFCAEPDSGKEKEGRHCLLVFYCNDKIRKRKSFTNYSSCLIILLLRTLWSSLYQGETSDDIFFFLLLNLSAVPKK